MRTSTGFFAKANATLNKARPEGKFAPWKSVKTTLIMVALFGVLVAEWAFAYKAFYFWCCSNVSPPPDSILDKVTMGFFGNLFLIPVVILVIMGGALIVDTWEAIYHKIN